MRFHSMLVATLVGGSWLGAARAAEEPLTCAQAYEKAQEEKTAGRLNAAIQHLKSCIDPSCAKFIREDCVRWMDQTESALPTVVFSVREDGKDLTDVEIQCDNKPLTGTLDGKALPVDPGLHDFVFSIQGLAPMGRQVLIREGGAIELSTWSSAGRARVSRRRRQSPAPRPRFRSSPTCDRGHVHYRMA